MVKALCDSSSVDQNTYMNGELYYHAQWNRHLEQTDYLLSFFLAVFQMLKLATTFHNSELALLYLLTINLN